MKVAVMFFAVTRELTGHDLLEIDLPEGSTTAHLLEHLLREHPRLFPWKPYLRTAVNRSYVAGDARLADGDEVALIPPVSGG